MFAKHSFVLETAEASAEERAMRDRELFLPFMRKVEEMLSLNRDVILGGENAVKALIKESIDKDSFYSVIYAQEAEDFAKKLADAFYKLDPDKLGKYAVMKVKNPHREFTVSVDMRELVRVYALPTHRSIKIADVVLPSSKPAIFAPAVQTPISCLGAEILLMGIYRDLCNPTYASKWERLLGLEKQLRRVFYEEIKAKIASATGGADGGTQSKPDDTKLLLMLSASSVLIGPNALGSTTPRGRWQFVTDEDLQDVAKKAQPLTKAQIFDDLKLPTDPRLRKLTLHLKDKQIDVFNAGSYGLLPYAEKTVAVRSDPGTDGIPFKVGTPQLLLRFTLVDMWVVQLIARLNAITQQTARVMLNRALERFRAAEKEFEAAAAETLFPETWLGNIVDDDIAAKRAIAERMKEKRMFFQQYYPASAT